MDWMDAVQVAILLLLALWWLKPLYARWLPACWRGMARRLLPPRQLKKEGVWRRNASDSDEQY